MSGLVGYASSDEEDDIQPSKPAKIAKTDAHDAATKKLEQQRSIPNPTNTEPSLPAKASFEEQTPPAPAGPSARPIPQPDEGGTLSTPPASPYTTERSLLRNLTMPTHPNFNIPSSPSPPPQNSEEAATLSTTTKKFERFLELKKQGVHFNARLQNSASLRNPSLLPKLMEFAGMNADEGEGYESTLSAEAGGVPARWPQEWYVENLMRENERRAQKAKGQRTEVGFVKEKGAKEGTGSQGSTPGAGSGSGSEHRKSKFERR